MNIEGHYQYPGLAASVAASLHLTDNGSTMVLNTGSSNTTFALEQVTVSDALGSIPLILTFPDGGRFVPADDPVFVPGIPHDAGRGLSIGWNAISVA